MANKSVKVANSDIVYIDKDWVTDTIWAFKRSLFTIGPVRLRTGKKHIDDVIKSNAVGVKHVGGIFTFDIKVPDIEAKVPKNPGTHLAKITDVVLPCREFEFRVFDVAESDHFVILDNKFTELVSQFIMTVNLPEKDDRAMIANPVILQYKKDVYGVICPIMALDKEPFEHLEHNARVIEKLIAFS